MDAKEATETFMEVVNARRSVRDYTPKAVTEEELRMILESARRAPSGGNAQPWRFIVVKDEANKEFLSMLSRRGSGRRFTGEFLSNQMQKRFEGMKDEEKKMAAYKKLTSGDVSAFVREPDVVLIVIGKKDAWELPLDTSAAIENILLAAAAAGLGACWVIGPCLDIRDEIKLKEYFNIPEDYKAVSIIAVGEPSRMPNPRPRIALEDLVFAEKFGAAYYQKEGE